MIPTEQNKELGDYFSYGVMTMPKFQTNSSFLSLVMQAQR